MTERRQSQALGINYHYERVLAWDRFRDQSECVRSAYARAMREVIAKRMIDVGQMVALRAERCFQSGRCMRPSSQPMPSAMTAAV
jgi:hypothetical protein